MSKLPSGTVALVFKNKKAMARCLDRLAEYGFVYGVVPWTTIYVPTALGKICLREGLVEEVHPVERAEDIDPATLEHDREIVFQAVKHMLRDAGVIPGGR